MRRLRIRGWRRSYMGSLHVRWRGSYTSVDWRCRSAARREDILAINVRGWRHSYTGRLRIRGWRHSYMGSLHVRWRGSYTSVDWRCRSAVRRERILATNVRG